MNSQNRVLQLNQGYLPSDIVSWRQSVNLVIGRDKAVVVKSYEDAPGIFRPAVIQLTTWSPDPYAMFGKKRFSKTSVFIRDRWQCQYCAKKCNKGDITIDHVTPRFEGGESTYSNCVASCKKCNDTKKNQSLEKAGMSLLRPVRKPTLHDKFHTGFIPPEWNEYLGFVIGIGI